MNQRIDIEKEAILAFMLYDAEGNIGQVKRDLKLVCAKSFYITVLIMRKS
ncbi:hypothetical protein EfmAA96_08010 [Enterococcus faecium]|nr:hypothetical protein EfmAA96_08010 [Enterococcus faecium]